MKVVCSEIRRLIVWQKLSDFWEDLTATMFMSKSKLNKQAEHVPSKPR
jgi:hypothetical protein